MNTINKIIVLIAAVLLVASVHAEPALAAAQPVAPVCQSREQVIKKRSKKLIGLASNAMEVFDRVANRTGNIYASRVARQGKTVPNYQALVTQLNGNKAATVSLLNQAKVTAAKFSCAAGNPQASVTQFHDEMGAVKNALQNYRVSIHNLIAAVAKVNGENIQ
ncbi:hypothetical protein HY065_02030 [Candidatus Berkelbacteria bacterium]|nr:hypothetical protein [Candidatus Berkelbacteria bacterium]